MSYNMMDNYKSGFLARKISLLSSELNGSQA